MNFNFLTSGLDTVECAYYLTRYAATSELDYDQLAFEKEQLRHAKGKQTKHIRLGNSEFILHPYGSSSGYPFIIENDRFTIAFGQHNTPNFFVKFKSIALWHAGLQILHNEFLEWAKSIGYQPYRNESLSRVDTSFDYVITDMDIDENNIISLSKKDSRYRDNGDIQTFSYGKGDVVLRIYNKVAEIQEKSQKTWFFDIWGVNENVWRIEWQTRKSILKRFGIKTIDNLFARQGDLLRYLATEHDTVRTPSEDRNRSRWALHPLWCDLQNRIDSFSSLGIHRELNAESQLEEKLMRNAISIYGYLKQTAALNAAKSHKNNCELDDALKLVNRKLRLLHDDLTWQIDVEKRVQKLRFHT